MKTKYKVIIGGQNFGCGSSREHAPVALGAAGRQNTVVPSSDACQQPSQHNSRCRVHTACPQQQQVQSPSSMHTATAGGGFWQHTHSLSTSDNSRRSGFVNV